MFRSFLHEPGDVLGNFGIVLVHENIVSRKDQINGGFRFHLIKALYPSGHVHDENARIVFPIAAKDMSAVRTHDRRPLGGVRPDYLQPQGVAGSKQEIYSGRQVDVTVHDHEAIGSLQIACDFVRCWIKEGYDGFPLGDGILHAEVELPLLDVELGFGNARRYPSILPT